LRNAAVLIRENEQALVEIEELMEEEHGYMTIKDNIGTLKTAMLEYMVDQDIAQAPADGGRFSLVRRTRTRWNPDKLKKILSKSQIIKVSRFDIDPEKLDDLVRQGKLDRKKIAPALEQTPEKPHIRWYDSSDEDAASEEAALKEAMS
jgi:hypothetical protein